MKLENLAIKADLEQASRWVERAEGLEVVTRHALDGSDFLTVRLGDTLINVFESALYESAAAPLPSGWLHASFSVEDLDLALEDSAWSECLVFGPTTISGTFGRRRIAFLEPFAGVRIELMEELDGDD